MDQSDETKERAGIPAQAFEPTDEALYERFRVGKERAALDQLILRHQHFGYRAALSVCKDAAIAEEAVQEAFLQLLNQRCDFTPRGDGSFHNWFFRVVVNSARFLARTERNVKRRPRSRRYQERSALLFNANETARELTTSEAEREETYRKLNEALFSLQEELRVTLTLHFVEGASQTDIGRTLGVSQQLVRKRLVKGMDLLRKRLAQSGVVMGATALPALFQTAAPATASVSLAVSLAKLAAGELSGVGMATTASAGHVASAAAAGAGKIALAAIGVVFAATIVGGGFWLTFHSLEPSTSSVVPQLHWTFDQPPPEGTAGLDLFKGRWDWRQNETGGAMETTDGILAVLPKHLPPLPLAIEARIAIKREITADVACVWYNTNLKLVLAGRRTFSNALSGLEDRPLRVCFIVTETTVTTAVEGMITEHSRYPHEKDADRLMVRFKACTLDELLVRPANADDLRLAADADLCRSWTFDQPPPEGTADLELFKGCWDWRQNEAGGAMETTTLAVITWPKERLPALPLTIEARIFLKQEKTAGLNCAWVNLASGLSPDYKRTFHSPVLEADKQPLTIRFVVTEKDIATVVDRTVSQLARHTQSESADRLGFRFSDCLVDELHLRRATAEEILLVKQTDEEYRLLAGWDFNDAEPTRNLRAVSGSWELLKDQGPDRSPCLGILDRTSLLLDEPLEVLPVVVEYQCAVVPPVPSQAFLIVPQWTKRLRTAVFDRIGEQVVIPPRHWSSTWRIYVTEKTMDVWYEGKRRMLLVGERRPGAKLLFEFRGGHTFDNLAVRRIPAAEIPDTSEYVNAVETIPPEKRVGVVDFPKLKSVAPDQPVRIEFYPPTETEK